MQEEEEKNAREDRWGKCKGLRRGGAREEGEEEEGVKKEEGGGKW